MSFAKERQMFGFGGEFCMKKKMAFLDVETSGLDPKVNEIIRFTAVINDEIGNVKVVYKFAKPKDPLSKEMENFLCITNEQLKDCDRAKK